MYAGGYDRSIKAIDLKTGEVVRAFVAAGAAITCMVVLKDLLFVAGEEQVVRSFDLTTGESRLFEGHTGWVLCMTTYTNLKEDGSVESVWLFTGSDDNSVRIWDIKTGQCLEELTGHKNGVTSMAIAGNDLYSGSYDNYTICWSLTDIFNKIRELQLTTYEDLRSHKFEAFEEYMESKGKRKKAGKKKTGKK